MIAASIEDKMRERERAGRMDGATAVAGRDRRPGLGLCRAGHGSADASRRKARLEEAFFACMSGFALLSTGFFVLAHAGHLTPGGASALVATLVAGLLAVGRRRGALREARRVLPSALAAGVALAAASSLFAAVLPPIDTTVAGGDGSIYLAPHSTSPTRDD